MEAEAITRLGTGVEAGVEAGAGAGIVTGKATVSGPLSEPGLVGKDPGNLVLTVIHFPEGRVAVSLVDTPVLALLTLRTWRRASSLLCFN